MTLTECEKMDVNANRADGRDSDKVKNRKAFIQDDKTEEAFSAPQLDPFMLCQEYNGACHIVTWRAHVFLF